MKFHRFVFVLCFYEIGTELILPHVFFHVEQILFYPF